MQKKLFQNSTFFHNNKKTLQTLGIEGMYLSIIKVMTSLVLQRIKIHLPIQGTRVCSLVQEDYTCGEAAKPMCHKYGACALHLLSLLLQLLKPVCPEPVLYSKRCHCNEEPIHPNEESPHLLQLEKACTQQQRHSVAMNKERKEK